MPLTSNSTFIDEKNKQKNAPIWLYEIQDYDGGDTNLYFARYDTNISFNGNTYIRFPISHEPLSENTQGEIDTVAIRLSNVSRLIQSYLEANDLRGKKVIVTQVFANQLATAAARIEMAYYIDNYIISANDVIFRCSSIMDVLDLTLPMESYNRYYCRYKDFKGTRCQYAGDETECNRTLQRCRELDNSSNFGGFPSITGRRLSV